MENGKKSTKKQKIVHMILVKNFVYYQQAKCINSLNTMRIV